MNLTQEEFNILAHVVIDPQAWAEAAEANSKIDEKAALKAKVDRWRSMYMAEKDNPDYKTRAVREADSDAREKQERLDILAKVKIERDKQAQELNDAITAEVTRQLSARP